VQNRSRYSLVGKKGGETSCGPRFKELRRSCGSTVVNCESQEEVDHYWEKLSAGGDEKAQQCGWLKDKYGLSWQVVPTVLTGMVNDPDPEKSQRAMKAMLQMKKIDIAGIRKALEG
jgi:predicted 3-demethylubiquinone-9 3-methyltransferase (glyoxalase superfamily)